MSKTMGEMTPEERREVTGRAIAQFQAELTGGCAAYQQDPG